jgi:hypothetical protein
MKGLSIRVLLLLLGILFVSLFMSFKMNERFGPREGFEDEIQGQDINMNSPPVESIPEPPQTQDQDILISKPISIDSTEPATKHVPTNPMPANTVNAMSQRLGLTSEDKTNMQSIITKVFANAGTFAAEKLGHMMEGFESKSSIDSSPYNM